MGYSKKEFTILLNAKGFQIDRIFKKTPCYLIDGNIMGHTLAIPEGLDYYQDLLAKGFKTEKSFPESLTAAINLELFSHGESFKYKHESLLKRLKFMVASGYDMAKSLSLNDAPFRLSILNHFHEVLKLFMSFNVVNINRFDNKGRTPIFESFDSIFWPNGIPPEDWAGMRSTENQDKKNARLEIVKFIFNNGGRRQFNDLEGKGLIHYATLELPYSQEILNYLKEKGSN